MPRYALLIEYEGTAFSGWQYQPDRLTVQGVLQRIFLRITGKETTVWGAGRTDTGVHATGQVGHVELDRTWDCDTLMRALNAYLKDDAIAVLEVAQGSEDFHARFSALYRRYRYLINNRSCREVLAQQRAWWVRRPLDVHKMQAQAQFFVGHHDFSSFRSAECGASSSWRTVDEVYVWREGDWVGVDVKARSFLHNQVRIMVGTLVQLGASQRSHADVEQLLSFPGRHKAGQTAPPWGLYLTEVGYTQELFQKRHFHTHCFFIRRD